MAVTFEEQCIWRKEKKKLFCAAVYSCELLSFYFLSLNIDFALQLLPLKLYGCSRGVERNERQSRLRRNRTGEVVVTLYIVNVLDLKD